MKKDTYNHIFAMIAHENNVTVEEVRSEIQAAINAAYTAPNKSAEVLANQASITSAGAVPTPEEMILYLATELKKG